MTHSECTRLVDLRRTDGNVLLLIVVREELVHDVERLFVDLEVVVVLQLVDREHAARLLDEVGILVHCTGPRGLLVHLANLQDVVETVKCDLNDLVVHHLQQVTQRLDAALGDEVADLAGLEQPAGRGVRDGPARFLLCLEVGVLEDVDQGWDDVCVDDGLDLMRGAGGDVGDGPARLLADRVLWRGEEREEGRKGARGDHDLGLKVVTSDDVAN